MGRPLVSLLLSGFVIGSSVTLIGHAQSDQKPLAFEVASVKQNTSGPGTPQRVVVQPGDRVTFTNVATRVLILEAYADGSDHDLVGGPDWIGKSAQPNFDVPRFDVAAKANRPVTRDELRAMLRGLLAERFKLVTHTEMRGTPIFALVMARRDGSLGPQLHQARASCAELRAAAQTLERGKDPCGAASFANFLMTGTMSIHGFALNQLGALAREVGRPVVDKTGLTGFFDWDLTWTPQRFLQQPFDRAQFPTIDPNGPSIFTALQEQLGLKLESHAGEHSVIMIDHVERPTPD